MAVDEQLHSRIENDFSYHPPTTELIRHTHEVVRATIKQIAHDLSQLVPPGREQSIMLTKLEEATFWANAAIARNQ